MNELDFTPVDRYVSFIGNALLTAEDVGQVRFNLLLAFKPSLTLEEYTQVQQRTFDLVKDLM